LGRKRVNNFSSTLQSCKVVILKGITLYNDYMKKVALVVIVSLIFSACAGSGGIKQGERLEKNPARTVTEDQMSGEVLEVAPGADAGENVLADDDASNATTSEEPPVDLEFASGVECYPDGIHPIGLSIAEQFEEITTYQEVMNWFCSGAEFEDILNALLTEELSDGDAESFLIMIAEGATWDEIWLELGITDQ
jgi:hypothetical protein